MSEKNNLNKIIIGVIILIILFLIFFFGYKFYVSKNISLNLDEKTYYVHHSTTYNLPIATAFDKNDKKLDVIVTIYKDGKEVDNIDTNHVGDKFIVYYKTTSGDLSLKKHITIKIILNPDLLKYQITGINSEWTNKDVLLTFVPNETNIKKYCFDGKCSEDNIIKVTKNGKYETYIIDEYGNESDKKEIEISNIDKTAPKVKKVSEYSKNGIFYLGVTVTDDESGVQAYSFDNGKTFSQASTLKVTKNATIKIFAKDAAGNISELYTYNYVVGENEPVTDTEAPTFTVTKLPDTEWSNTNVTVTVNATDNASGVKAYSFDNGSTWQVGNTKVFDASNNIKVRVKDNLGNISEYEGLSINVDKTAPIINNVVNNATYTANVTFEVVEDNLDTAILKKNGTNITYATTLTENGTYSLVVTDRAGNSTTRVFTINKGSLLIIGVADGDYYNYNVTPGVNDGTTLTKTTLTLDGNIVNNYTIGDVLSEEGTYALSVQDNNNNSDAATFVIDKTDPELLSELSTTDDNTLLTARDFSLDTVVLSKNDTPTVCFSETAKTEDGISCTVTDYYNMDFYRMLEYSFAADNTANYTMVAKDKAGNETAYDMDSDIIPIYSIGDFESIGSNTIRTINGKDRFMASTASYRLMNNLDYNNTKYNQITAGTIASDDSIDYYTLSWQEEHLQGSPFTLNNLSLANIQDYNTGTPGTLDHVEVTIGDITYVDLNSQYMDDLFSEPVTFSKIKSGDNYVDLATPVSMLCLAVSTDSGDEYYCDVENDDSMSNILVNGINYFPSSAYSIYSQTDLTIDYAITMDEDGTILYFRTNKSDDSLVGIYDAEGNDCTDSLLGPGSRVFIKLYERTLGGNTYLIFTTIAGGFSAINNDLMIPVSFVTSDSTYLYFTKDGIQYKLNMEYKTALDDKGYASITPGTIYYCESACENMDNWLTFASKGIQNNIGMYLYSKLNWVVNIRYELPNNNGEIWDTRYYGNGYGDGDIKPNNFYIDTYKRYFILKYENNWYKHDIINDSNYIFNRESNSWAETDAIELFLETYRLDSNSARLSPNLSINLQGNDYTISNFTNSATNAISTVNATGLFGELESATIKNLNISGAKLYGLGNSESGLCNNYACNGFLGILSSKGSSTNIINVGIENSNIYPTTQGDEIGILLGQVFHSNIKNNSIESTIIHERAATISPAGVTRLGGLVGTSVNTNIINNNIDITNNADDMAGIAYYAGAIYEGTELSNIYNSYISGNVVSYKNRSGIPFNDIYKELYEYYSRYKVNISDNTLNITE